MCKEIEAAGGDAVPNHDSVSDFEGAGRMISAAVDNFGLGCMTATFLFGPIERRGVDMK